VKRCAVKHGIKTLLTGSQQGLRRYLNYTGGDFKIFRPAGRLFAPMGDVWREGSYTPYFTVIGVGVGRGPKNCKFYVILEYKRFEGAYPLHNFMKLSGFVRSC